MTKITCLDEFLQVHGVLLASAGLPSVLHEQLFDKLRTEHFDGGSFFHIDVCENGKQRRLLLSSPHISKHSQVFLIDHAWSFRLADARSQLEQYPGLVERLSAMMCVSDNFDETEELDSNLCAVEDAIMEAKQQATETGKDVCWLELDEKGIDDEKLKSLELSSNFPSLVGLSLWGNKLSSQCTVIEALAGLKQLKALWINENPVVVNRGGDFESTLLLSLSQLEIYNSKFTKNYGKWAVGFSAGVPSAKSIGIGNELNAVMKVDLSDRRIQSLYREVFNPVEMPLLSYINLRDNPLNNDSKSSLFETLRSFPNLQSLEINIPGPLGRNGIEVLEGLPNLSELNGVKVNKVFQQGENIVEGKLTQRLPQWSRTQPVVDRILQEMWAYVMTYRLCDEEKLDETPIWYVMDELGSAIRHSDEPNFRVAPFMYMPDGTLQSAISFSLLWPINDVFEGDECTRDYLFGFGEERQRSARLTAWFNTPKHYFEEVYYDHVSKLSRSCLKMNLRNIAPKQNISMADQRTYTVYTDLPQVSDTLRRPEFTFCDDPSKADILWTSMQIDDELKKTFGLRDDQYVNQFPFEACLVMKHHLAKTVQQAYGAPPWIQPTYDMETEMEALIGDYFVREGEGRNNLWIVKPWNMARTIDTSITDYLPAIIRLAETGPKICQKYLEYPALFQGKKFDLRYIVLVRSLDPLEIFLSNVFWARISNNKYTLERCSLTDYETHFTVMNYGRKLVHVNTHDFVPMFEEEHQVSWKSIHEKVRKMLRELFEGAIGLHPEMQSANARAIYGVDVLLSNDFEPKLLEVTYCPDCSRACKYDVKNVLGSGELMKATDFFNDVFGCLFLNASKNIVPL